MISEKRKKREIFQKNIYVASDSLASVLSYSVLFFYRKKFIETRIFEINTPFDFDINYLFGALIFTGIWLSIYQISGYYNDIFRRSRLREFFQTFNQTLFGSILLFFLFLLDDFVSDYRDYYKSFFIFFSYHFLLTFLFRFILSSRTNYLIQKGKIYYNAIIIGSNQNAVELYNNLVGKSFRTGHKFVGFVSVDNDIKFLLEKKLKYLGNYTEIDRIMRNIDVEEVIIAVESREHDKVQDIITRLEGEDVKVKMIPDTYDILSGKVKLESYGEPLVEIPTQPLSVTQAFVKRLFDIVVSIVVLTGLSPVFLISMILVRASGSGPIFFKQERIGYKGQKFKIIKFRSMIADAETNGPQLSCEDDPRITPWGRIMRKYRIDELPQFFNVLKGEMSVVGPRPEREYYINKIVKIAPYYRQLHKLKPGITSWGMVKFGYAENVDEMVQRLKYDLVYLENANFLNDIKILFYTILIVLQGRGK